MKITKNKFAAMCFILSFLMTIAAAQTGGDFTITQSVIASGGGRQTTGGTFSIDSTIGQPLAGGLISNPPFDLFSGFWTPELSLQTGTVSGKITYANALTTPPVSFTTLTAAGSLPLSTMTDSNGDYSFSGFGAGAYTITPSKTGQVNGISNLDASRIAQHIVGLTTLNANQIIAADTSGNGAVSNLDASFLAQFIASIPNPGITGTWKFLPANRSYPNVQTNQTNQDYSAILVGDVTGNWNPAGPLHPKLSELKDDLTKQTDKTGQQVAVTAGTNQAVEEREALTVDLTATKTTGAGILGYQLEVLYDAAVIEPQEMGCDVSETISRGMTAICRVSESGVLKVVVFGAAPLSGEGTLLKLNFKVVGARGSTSPFSIRNFMFNEDNPQEVAIDGQVSIADSTADRVSIR